MEPHFWSSNKKATIKKSFQKFSMNEGKIKHITPLLRGFYDNGES